jgi:hypothetical protein
LPRHSFSEGGFLPRRSFSEGGYLPRPPKTSVSGNPPTPRLRRVKGMQR